MKTLVFAIVSTALGLCVFGGALRAEIGPPEPVALDRRADPGSAPTCPRDRWVDPSSLEPGTRGWLKGVEGQRSVDRSRDQRTETCPHDFDVIHYDITLTIDLSGRTIAGDTHVLCVSETAGLTRIGLNVTAKGLPTGVTLDPDTWVLGHKQLMDDTGVAAAQTSAPAALVASPNPFQGSTTIRFGAGAAGATRAEIYSPTGRRVCVLRRQPKLGGGDSGGIVWDGRDERGLPVPSGAHLCRVSGAGNPRVVRVTLVR